MVAANLLVEIEKVYGVALPYRIGLSEGWTVRAHFRSEYGH